MSAPSVPAGFLKDLDMWSLKECGEKGQFRPDWNEDDEVWQIQRLFGETWVTIMIVQDETKATREKLRHFRPLDGRVFEELMATSLMARFGTGDPERDAELYRAEQRLALEIAKDARRLGSMNRLLECGEEARPMFARLKADLEQGHHHGTRMVYATRGA